MGSLVGWLSSAPLVSEVNAPCGGDRRRGGGRGGRPPQPARFRPQL